MILHNILVHFVEQSNEIVAHEALIERTRCCSSVAAKVMFNYLFIGEQVECWDWDSNGKHDLVGGFDTTLGELIRDGPGKQVGSNI